MEEFLIRGAGPTPEQGKARNPKEAPEGVSGQYIESGSLNIPLARAVSLTQIKVLDLISEGEIDGLVSGEYSYVGVAGEVGYRSATFKPYQLKSINNVSIPYLRSIYWNKTPVVDKDNLFNFQQIDVSFSKGGPNGTNVQDIGDELTVTRNIQERLRGPNSKLDSKKKQQIIGEVEQFSKYYRILNKDCMGVVINVRINSLYRNITEGNKAGDTTASNIFYRIYYKPIFNKSGTISAENFGPEEQEGYIFGKEEEINGKITFGYIRSSRVEFDSSFANQDGFVGWAIKIFRLTPDSLIGALRNQTYIDSLTEVYSNAYGYPNSAIVAQKFSAEYFSSIPARAFDTRLLKVKVPSNYNPIQKTYEGEWDGSWRLDADGNEGYFWSDNPAWCFYDLLTNKRYGLGKYIDNSLIDKWTLYEIAQYCDTLVPDGFGGVEPRFTCNLVINDRQEAYKIINDMASIFRAIVYYYAGGIYSSMDSIKTYVHQFTNQNVEDGNFNYSSSSKRVRHSVAIVRFNDKTNFYQPAIEYVEDAEAIKKYGYRELEITAFGCTSRGQAIRYGRWALLSESLETETISFQAGLDSNYLRPGDVFKVFDKYRKNSRRGGRLYDAYGTQDYSTIILDDYVTGLQPNTRYNLSIATPTYNYDISQINGIRSSDIQNIRRPQIQTVQFSGGDTSYVSGKMSITIRKDIAPNLLNFESYNVPPNSIWTLETTSTLPSDSEFTNQWEYYRVIKVEEKEDNKYAINGLQYNEDKYTAIDSGLNFQNEVITADIPSRPDSVTVSFENVPNSVDLKGIKYTIAKSDLSSVNGFLVYVKNGDWEPSDFNERFLDGSPTRVVDETPDSRYLINITDTVNILNLFYIPLSNGVYNFRVYSRNYLGVPSNNSATAQVTVTNLNSFQSLVISSLRVDGNTDNLISDKADDEYLNSAPSFIWQSTLENTNSNYNLGDIAYRVSIRKSTSPTSSNPALPSERVGDDPYQPSNVIYYQESNYLPSDQNNPTFTFDIVKNMSSITSYYEGLNTDFTGIIRDYDVVVEAHLPNGDSSAGGNIYGSRMSVVDSAFLTNRKKGWDILHVNNTPVPKINLTDMDGLDSCLIAQATDLSRICTEQWISPDGTANIKIHTNNLPSDLAGGFLFSCVETFTQAEAYDGVNSNGKSIFRSEFADVSNLILAQTNLLGYSNGYLAISFYDNFDKDFRTEALKINPSYNDTFFKNLNMSDPVEVRNRGIAENQGTYVAWGSFELKAQPNSTNLNALLNVTDFKWVGAGVTKVEVLNRYDFVAGTTSRPTALYVKMTFDSVIIPENDNYGHVSNYIYGQAPINNAGEIGVMTYQNNKKLLMTNDTLPSNTVNNYFKIVELPENVSIDTLTNQEITFKILIPHIHEQSNFTITDPSQTEIYLAKYLTYAKVFAGLMRNGFDGIHTHVLPQNI